MKTLPQTQIGSWQQAVTTSDGAWLTRGSFSKNFTFTVRNFMNNSLLYYLHLCQRGNDDIDDTLYPRTSKSAEGYAAEKCFQQAKQEKMNVEVNWQDNDSSSIKSFKNVYQGENNKVMFCGGHVTRAHTNQLNKLAAMKSASAAFISRHKAEYPKLEKIECTCQKRHFPNCGCLSEKFVRQARINHSCAIVEAGHTKNPQTYRDILLQLGKYHSRNVHVWKGGNCVFHPLNVCSCGTCDEKSDPTCKGKPYSSKSSLSCEFHALLYEIELNERAKMADKIIHPDLGKGHSNFPEASHCVWSKFRSKNSNIQRLHYIVSTNLELLQSNMSWFIAKKGLTYHWLLELYSRLSLLFYQVYRKLA
ncbi:uncharacterized protein [Ptychodera flava]|uniref:uncharacterized protein isoform X1 n=1 Tax=Ptychodera flava TaxID=63121 RepID=UPI00396A46FF